MIKIDDEPIYWTIKRQSLAALSSVEAEHVLLSQCTKQVQNLRRLVTKLKLDQPIYDEATVPATEIITDSTSVIYLTSKPQVSERKTHIDTKTYHINELQKLCKSFLKYTQTYNIPEDALTKSNAKTR